jgi:hypothetical protein
MHRAAEMVAERLFGSLGIDPVAPVDLERIAAGLGVDSVRAAELVEDGRLERRAGRIEILVRRDRSIARRRFTLAHELAHLVLGSPGPDGHGPSVREERRCDEVAAALLLPRAWVAATYGGRPQTLATVRSLARDAGVSVSTAVTRLDEVLGWKRALLRFRRQDGRWRFLGACAVPAPAAGTIRSAPGTSAALDSIAARSGRDTDATVPVGLFDTVVEIAAEVSVRAGSALVLAEAAAFSRLPGPTPARGAPRPDVHRSPRTGGG